jgi:hypothetical protein
MIRRLVAVTGLINGIIAVGFAFAAAVGLLGWARSMSSANSPNQFGSGMLVGGLLVIFSLVTLVFTAIAYDCLCSYRRIKAGARPRKVEIVRLAIAVIAALVVVAVVASWRA